MNIEKIDDNTIKITETNERLVDLRKLEESLKAEIDIIEVLKKKHDKEKIKEWNDLYIIPLEERINESKKIIDEYNKLKVKR